MSLLTKTWTFFIVWLNVFCGIWVLNMDETSLLHYAVAALNFVLAALCYPELLPKLESNEEEQLKIKLAVMTLERDACIAHLDYHTKNSFVTLNK